MLCRCVLRSFAGRSVARASDVDPVGDCV